jgi:hypothetical protein
MKGIWSMIMFRMKSLKEEDLIDELCPGSKIRSAGLGRGEGTGEGKGPIGYSKGEEW